MNARCESKYISMQGEKCIERWEETFYKLGPAGQQIRHLLIKRNRCFTDTRQKVGIAPEVMQPSSSYSWLKILLLFKL